MQPLEFTVTEISNYIKMTVEGAFPQVRVRGEISGFKFAPSGHAYLNLKDGSSVLAAVCWRGNAMRFTFKPEDGLEVIASGSITTYAGQSKYQLIINSLQPAGQGALMALLEKRKKKLEAEGLFAESRKKPLPYLPKVIGVITSPTGAVIRDILHRISDRFPTRIILWPVLVQGEKAAGQITEAIHGFNQLKPDGAIPKPDLLIVARGGGSVEDLWAFNEEEVVRAAAESAIPLISAIGHETDITLLDYAADLRAPTPTAAAEMAVPVKSELILMLEELHRRSFRGIYRFIEIRENDLKALVRAIPNPQRFIEDKAQRFDNILLRLHNVMRNLLREKEQKLDMLGRLIESYSYKRVLERGFALVYDSEGKIINSAKLLTPGEQFEIEFADGNVGAEVRGAE